MPPDPLPVVWVEVTSSSAQHRTVVHQTGRPAHNARCTRGSSRMHRWDDLRMRAEEVLARLDAEQREAAVAVRGPVCILAGAGTGKTRTITHRIAYGVLSGAIPASQLQAVTFTAR